MAAALRLLGLPMASVRKVAPAHYRVPLRDTTRAVLQRTIFDGVFQPGWITQQSNVMLVIHKLVASPATTTPSTPYVLRAKLQHRLAGTLDHHALAMPLAYGVLQGSTGPAYFVLVTSDNAPAAKLIKRTISPVGLAGVEYTIAHLWGKGFSFSEVPMFFIDPKTSLPILYDLETLANAPWPKWKKKELARLKSNLSAIEKMYLSSPNTADAAYLVTLRRQLRTSAEISDLHQARLLM